MKTEFLYLALIGISIVALAGVMRIGKSILAPPHVSGVWRITDETGNHAADPCGPPSPGALPLELEIAQSGTVMELVFRGDHPVRTVARLRGDTLFASPLEPIPPCTDRWSLRAQFNEADAPERVTGLWTATDCDECAPRRFTATRRDGPERSEG